MKIDKTVLCCAGGAILSVLAGQASALPITIDVVAADWTNVVPQSVATSLTYRNTDGQPGFEEIRWGASSTPVNQKSGYRFEGAPPPAFTVETSDAFSFGELTHFNFAIPLGTSITSAQLNISANLI